MQGREPDLAPAGTNWTFCPVRTGLANIGCECHLNNFVLNIAKRKLHIIISFLMERLLFFIPSHVQLLYCCFFSKNKIFILIGSYAIVYENDVSNH